MSGKEFLEGMCEAGLEYLFLGSLISSDSILTEADAKKALKDIERYENALDSTKLAKEKKEELRKFFNKGKNILYGDIERFNKTEGSNDGGVVPDCKSGPAG